MAFASIQDMLSEQAQSGAALWTLILENDLKERQSKREDSLARMNALWQEMRGASTRYNGALRSVSGMVGGDGARMQQAVDTGTAISGAFSGKIIARALQMAESNACMKRIVAAPTAGSCGVLPAVLLTYQEEHHAPDTQMVEALYVAAGFGEIIASRASISGAAGGCQAEIGSASAMTAAALVYLRGGSAEQMAASVGFALQNLLGLVCDPVAGLVEVPCVKRNVIGALNAVSCADMALAGIQSIIPPDEVIDAMRKVGDSMPESLKETGLGGLAASPTGKQMTRELTGKAT